MRLREDLNVTAFLKSIDSCQGDVFFDTAEGDKLNLKSALCQYVFMMIAAEQPDIFRNGVLSITNDMDMAVIQKSVV